MTQDAIGESLETYSFTSANVTLLAYAVGNEVLNKLVNVLLKSSTAKEYNVGDFRQYKPQFLSSAYHSGRCCQH